MSFNAAPYQKTAVPEVSEGDRRRLQDGPSFPSRGHTMSSRGSRSIFGRTVRGHELVRDTLKEGDDNTKRSPAGKVYPWGVIDSTQQQKTLVLFRTTPNTPKGTTEKSYI